MARLYVGPVVTAMPRMSSGSAVIYVRRGFMASVSRSHRLGLSTSSITSAHRAATRELGHDMGRFRSLSSFRSNGFLGGLTSSISLMMVSVHCFMFSIAQVVHAQKKKLFLGL